MKKWEVQGNGIETLNLVDIDCEIKLKAYEILVKMKAATLNYRDLIMIAGGYGETGGIPPFIPISDGSGIVKEIGADISQFKKGDMVIPPFFKTWHSGNIEENSILSALGGKEDGVMQEYMIFSEENIVKAPYNWSFIESASLPCAALTAWRTIVTEGKVNKNSIVLIQGLGGVSILAIQIAKLFDAKVIVITSSAERMSKAKMFGADFAINYNENKEWWKSIQKITDKKGVDIVVEVGGSNTLEKSIKASKTGAMIGVIGVLSGNITKLSIGRVIYKASRLIGITCGSKEELISMIEKFNHSHIRPVIDTTFKFDDLPNALKYMAKGKHIGKIAIDFE